MARSERGRALTFVFLSLKIRMEEMRDEVLLGLLEDHCAVR
ncbi:hypothetical protein LCGC14_0445840 [marine sediment metagenome]|uniref:Uncharacterized protein n=1 Tax=marine sediment metagenome TaxID=412755 RepID=A0A0F9T290_9ZZZZ